MPAIQVSLDHDEITVGDIYLAAAQALTGSERALTDINAARESLIQAGVLTETILEHCPSAADRANNGQLLSILGSLYERLMEMK